MLVSSNFPLTSRKRGALPKTTVFARCPRSSARPVSEPPTHLPPGPGVWGISSREPEGFYEPTSLFSLFPPPFSSIHSKNSPPSPSPPSPSPGRERLVKGTVLEGGVPRRGSRGAGGAGGGDSRRRMGRGRRLGTLSSPFPLCVCKPRSEGAASVTVPMCGGKENKAVGGLRGLHCVGREGEGCGNRGNSTEEGPHPALLRGDFQRVGGC